VAGEGEKWEGEEKGARRRWGAILSRRGRVGVGGDGSREAPRGSEEWGRDVGASAAVGRRMCGRQWRSRAARVWGTTDRGQNRAVRDCQVGPQHSNGQQDLNSKKKKSNSI
jgi:hypothetical protein